LEGEILHTRVAPVDGLVRKPRERELGEIKTRGTVDSHRCPTLERRRPGSMCAPKSSSRVARPLPNPAPPPGPTLTLACCCARAPGVSILVAC